MEKIKLTIDGVSVLAEPDMTILQAAASVGIKIPTLCYLEKINCVGACRMCVVQADGRIVPACAFRVAEGMEVQTESEELTATRKFNLELICSRHRQDCHRCVRFPHCELHALCREYGLDDRINMFSRPEQLDESLPHLVRDHSKCILCRRCVSACQKVQEVFATGVVGRGAETRILTDPTECIHCGQCILACPTGALCVRSETKSAEIALSQRKKHVAVMLTGEAAMQVAEYFDDHSPPAACAERLSELLRRMGVKWVLREEKERIPGMKMQAAALLEKLNSPGPALLSAMCPAVRTLVEKQYPSFAGRFDTSENPYLLAAGQIKRRLAEENGLQEEDIYLISLSSCTARKADRDASCDAVLTSQEAYLMIEKACISSFSAWEVWHSIPVREDCPQDEEDSFPAMLTTLGADLKSVRRASEITEWNFEHEGKEFCIAQVSGMPGVKEVMEKMKDGSMPYAYVSMLACPGGCLNGGGKSRRGKNTLSEIRREGIR